MPSPPLLWIRTSTISPMPSCKLRKSRRPPTNSSEQAGGSSASACRASKLARTFGFFDATLVYAPGKPVSCSLAAGAASSETEEDFQRADPAALDFGALHGRHYHLRLHLHPDYGLSFPVSMGHSAH